jgi:hypothetical protein
LLQAQRNLLLPVVNLQHLDGDLLARLHDQRRIGDPGPTHFRNVQQSLHTAAKVDEGAELTHRGHPSG